MVRVVLETVGFVRGLINPRSRWGRILFDYAGDYELIVFPEIVLEILEVLRRPEVARPFRSLPDRDPARIVAILEHAEADIPPDMPRVARDPKDDKFLAAARFAGVDYLVSEDRDLLDLGDDVGIPIIDGERFLAILEPERADE